MLDTLSNLSTIGLKVLGWIVFAFGTTLVVLAGIAMLILIFKKLSPSNKSESNSIQYKLLKDFVYPMIKDVINDATKKGLKVMGDSKTKKADTNKLTKGKENDHES